MFNCMVPFSGALRKYATITSKISCSTLINRLNCNPDISRAFSNNYRDSDSCRDNCNKNRFLLPQNILYEQRRSEFVGFGKDFGRRFDKYDKENGKREIDPEVPLRFYRLSWGPWLRTYGARYTDLWKKSSRLKSRYKRHIFCNAHQSYKLDRMTTKVWTKRKYYIDDWYAPYEEREEFLHSRRKPLPATVLELKSRDS